VVRAVHEPHRCQQLARAAAAPPAADPGIDHRQFGILERRCAGQEIEGLEYEADPAATEGRALCARQASNVLIRKEVTA
jgi:hypothetical protein